MKTGHKAYDEVKKLDSSFWTKHFENQLEMAKARSEALLKSWEIACAKRDWLIIEHPPGSQFDFGGVTMNVVFHSAEMEGFVISMKAKYFDKTGVLCEHTFNSNEFPLREWLKAMPKDDKTCYPSQN